MTRPNQKKTSANRAEELTQHQEQVRDALRNFRIILSSVRRHFHWIEEQCGISGAQLWAMGNIQQTPNCKVSDLARAMSIHQSTASNLLEKLVSKGFVEKKRDLPDQRMVRLLLTAIGEDIVNRAPKPFDGILPNALGSLPSLSLANLNNSLAELVGRMAVKDESAASTPLSDIT